MMVNTTHVVSTAKQQQTRHTNTRATGVQKLSSKNRERGMTRQSERRVDQKPTPHMCKYVKHIHMCTHSIDDSERLQCRRAYRVLSERFGHGICFRSVTCATIPNLNTHNICTTLHTAILLVPQRQLDSVRHTRMHSRELTGILSHTTHDDNSDTQEHTLQNLLDGHNGHRDGMGCTEPQIRARASTSSVFINTSMLRTCLDTMSASSG